MSDRIRGLVLGLATGDVLGAPLEGLSPGAIREHFGRPDRLLDPAWRWAERPERARLAGLHTDDTQQAWAIAEVLIDHGHVVPGALAARFVALAAPLPGLPHGVQRGSGRTFREAVRALAAGAGALEAGIDSPTNGASMRVAVVAAGAPDLDRCVRRALVSGAITHRSRHALEPAAALAALAFALLSESPPAGRAAWIAAARDGAARAAHLLAQGYPVTPAPDLAGPEGAGDRAGPHARRSEREARAGGSDGFSAVLEALSQHDISYANDLELIASATAALRPPGRSGAATDSFAPASVAAAIAIAARATSYREAVEEALVAGHDTDTVAAMAGALSGAARGAGDIPADWLQSLIARDALEAVARALAGEPVTAPRQLPWEEEWSRRERSAIRHARPACRPSPVPRRPAASRCSGNRTRFTTEVLVVNRTMPQLDYLALDRFAGLTLKPDDTKI